MLKGLQQYRSLVVSGLQMFEMSLSRNQSASRAWLPWQTWENPFWPLCCPYTLAHISIYLQSQQESVAPASAPISFPLALQPPFFLFMTILDHTQITQDNLSILKFFLNNLFLKRFIYLCVLPACMHAHVCLGPTEVRREHHIWNRTYRCHESPCGCWESNWGSLEEHQEL